MVEENTDADTALKYPKGRYDHSEPAGGCILHDPTNSLNRIIQDILWKIGANIMTG